MEQLVILVIIGLISLVNWLLQKSAEKRELAKMKREAAEQDAASRGVRPQGRMEPVARRESARPGQDPMRELMEALGLPAEAAAPPPVVARSASVEEREEFASAEQPPPLPRKAAAPRVSAAWQPPPRRPRPDAKTERLASAFSAIGQGPTREEKRSVGLRGLLATETGRRQAVILAEILGTPRGLAPVGYETSRW